MLQAITWIGGSGLISHPLLSRGGPQGEVISGTCRRYTSWRPLVGDALFLLTLQSTPSSSHLCTSMSRPCHATSSSSRVHPKCVISCRASHFHNLSSHSRFQSRVRSSIVVVQVVVCRLGFRSLHVVFRLVLDRFLAAIMVIVHHRVRRPRSLPPVTTNQTNVTMMMRSTRDGKGVSAPRTTRRRNYSTRVS